MLDLQIISEQNYGGEKKCVSREELQPGRIISRQIFSHKQEDHIRNYQKARTNSTSCIKEQFTKEKTIQRACPFARINFEARHDVLHTRKCFYRFEPLVQWDGGLIQESTTVHDFFTRVHNTVNSECTGISQDTRQTIRDYLPELIYLGRSESYSFVFYLYLDYNFQFGEFSLYHLQTYHPLLGW